MAASMIAFMTDFGTADPFVGIVKGVIAGIAPEAVVIDLTHEIPPGDIRRAAITLWQAAPFFPPFTVFLAVVDPGVGTVRRPMMLQSNAGQPGKKYAFIGPDNGLFTFVLTEGFQAWELSNSAFRLPFPSTTFHGRDIFAPAAAHAARGVPGPQFGPSLPDPVRLPMPRLEETVPGSIAGEALSGEILFADRFGNYLTSLGVFERQGSESLYFYPWLPGAHPRTYPTQGIRIVLPDGSRLRLVDTFAAIPPGSLAGVVGSSGLLEIAANRASATGLLNLPEGAPITLETTGQHSTL